MTIQEVFAATKDKPETEIYLSHLLNKDRSFFTAHPYLNLSNSHKKAFEKFLLRKQGSEPLAYILGYQEFYGLKFIVNQNVLIPRPETERLVERALFFINKKPMTIVDVGTGSGNIAVSIAKMTGRIPVKVVAIDKSKKALEVARRNIDLHKLQNKVNLLHGSLLNPFEEKADLIVANLPYIASNKISTLQPEIRNWEPKMALDGGSNGLKLYKQLFSQAKAKLKQDGKIIFELNGEIFEKNFNQL